MTVGRTREPAGVRGDIDDERHTAAAPRTAARTTPAPRTAPRTTRALARAVLLASATLVGGATPGCMSSGRGPGGAGEWATTVAARHAQADELLDRGERQGALAVLEAVIDRPPGEAPTAEARRLMLQDTYFRVARLELEQRRPARAIERATAGLALGGGADLFAANLLIVRAGAREALGQAQAALDDYQRALAINESLLQRALSPTTP